MARRFRLIRVLRWLVPRARRDEWTREWEAELFHHQAQHDRRRPFGVHASVTRRSISAIWGDQGATAANTEPAGPALQQGILALTPTTDAQRWQQSQALSISNDIAKARWLSITGTNSPIPVSFLVIITFWLSSLFWSFGLFAPRNATVIAVMLLSAASVSACVLLILEMQTPFSGILRISSGPLQFALEQLGK